MKVLRSTTLMTFLTRNLIKSFETQDSLLDMNFQIPTVLNDNQPAIKVVVEQVMITFTQVKKVWREEEASQEVALSHLNMAATSKSLRCLTNQSAFTQVMK